MYYCSSPQRNQLHSFSSDSFILFPPFDKPFRILSIEKDNARVLALNRYWFNIKLSEFPHILLTQPSSLLRFIYSNSSNPDFPNAISMIQSPPPFETFSYQNTFIKNKYVNVDSDEIMHKARSFLLSIVDNQKKFSNIFPTISHLVLLNNFVSHSHNILINPYEFDCQILSPDNNFFFKSVPKLNSSVQSNHILLNNHSQSYSN